MTYEERVAAERMRRAEEAEQRRAAVQVDAAVRAAERNELGAGLMRMLTGGITTASIGESRSDVDARLWEAAKSLAKLALGHLTPLNVALVDLFDGPAMAQQMVGAAGFEPATPRPPV